MCTLLWRELLILLVTFNELFISLKLSLQVPHSSWIDFVHFITDFICPRYAVFITGSSNDGDIQELLNRDYSVPLYAGFLACLCSSQNPEEYGLILRCFPLHESSIVWKDVSSRHNVILHGEVTSRNSLYKEEEVFFSLSDDLTRTHKQNHMETTSIK